MKGLCKKLTRRLYDRGEQSQASLTPYNSLPIFQGLVTHVMRE